MATMGTEESDQCRQVTVVERLKQEWMHGLSAKKTVAAVERWPLVEVRITVSWISYSCLHLSLYAHTFLGAWQKSSHSWDTSHLTLKCNFFSHTYKRADHSEVCNKQFLNIIVIQRSDPNYLSFCDNVSPYMSLFRWGFINFSCYVTRQKYVSSLFPTAKVHKIPEQNKVYTFTKESTSHARYGSSSC